MNCPHCGRDVRDGERYCPYCGKPLDPASDESVKKTEPGENPPDPAQGYGIPPDRIPAQGPAPQRASRGPAILKAVLAVVLYLFLLFGIQSCVIGSYIGSNLDPTGVLYAAQSGDPTAVEKAYAEMLRSAMDLIYDKQALLLLISNLTAILALCLGFRLRRKKPAEEFALYGTNPARLVQFALFGVALNIVLTALISVLPLPESLFDMQNEQYAALYEGSLFVSAFSVAVVGPVTEELFFRGIAMTRLEPVLGGVGAVILSAALFGLAHGTPIAIGYAFVVGVVLALIYRKYRSILPGIVCHCFFNLASFLFPGELEGISAVVMTVLCAAVLVFTWHSAVIRFPGFSDVLWDGAGRLRSGDPEKQAVIRSLRSARASGSLDAETAERLAKEWDDAEKKDGGKED
ncbi:MAG: CPBP family intramembrane metalloprotease [Ruminococcaceae bacterium]|jgi:membrane protease YdiL (CAAX protease family)|nr:CPBP family intramembrane metalloprotease [Oscillospiraceae bacterium]